MGLTLLVLAIYAIVIIYGIRILPLEEAADCYLSKDHTNVLKGLCCVIVIFVHIPEQFSNSIQDMVGSFAYICVTLFFFISAYGLRWSFDHKPEYVNNFIKHRLLILLIPFIISCLLKLCFGFNPYSGGVRFVYVLLIFYAITYIVHRFKISRGGHKLFVQLFYSIVWEDLLAG